MNTEYEIRVLEIDKEQKRYVYDIIPKEDGKWIRLRTNGRKTTLTYKKM